MESMINWDKTVTDVDGHGQQNTIARLMGRSAINVVDLATMQGCVLPGPRQLQTPKDKDAPLAAPRGGNLQQSNKKADREPPKNQQQRQRTF